MTGSRTLDILRIGTEERTAINDAVAIEEPLEVRVNGSPFAVIMRTPGADRQLAAGFLLAEGVIQSGGELGAIEHCSDAAEEARQNTLNVTVIGDAAERLEARLAERRQVTMTSSCGMCGRRTIESLRSRVPVVDGRWSVPSAVIRAVPGTLRHAQTVFAATGGLHAAGLFSLDGALEVIAEDVGRHNAVDKVVGGRMLMDALPLDCSLLVVSGRTSFELVQKALVAGIPLVAAVSAPSSLAIQLAEECGVTLCGFVRGDTFNVYTHPQRIA